MVSTRTTRLRRAGLLALLAASIPLPGCGRKARPAPPPAAARTTVPAAAPSAPRAAPSRPAPPRTPPAAPREAIPAPLPEPLPAGAALGPPIRIGLTTSATEVRIAGELSVVERRPEAAREQLRGEVRLRLERPAGAESTVFRVQVAALAAAARAEDLARSLAERLGVPAVTVQSAPGAPFAVRVGAFPLRSDAEAFAAGPVAGTGYRQTLIVRDLVPGAASGEPRLTLRGADNLLRLSRSGFLFTPAAPGEFLRLDGKLYRGALEIIVSDRGDRLTVVNQLGVEEYLFGVVPAEIPPATYPERAALAAQAIAARTYAIRNLGRFRAEGFDLTADIRSQVYGGAGIEKPATNVAVRETAGLVLYYDGAPIDAMYSSTCGGRTEDFANVFGRPAVPYLVSVPCIAENGAGADPPAATLQGTHDLGETILGSDGLVANRNLEFARVLGLRTESWGAAHLGAPATAAELRGWVARARPRARPAAPAAEAPSDATRRAGFLRFAAESLFGTEEIERRISPSDAAYYLSNLADGAAVPSPSRRAIAFLMQRGLWQADPDNQAHPERPVRRADALAWLGAWSEAASGETLREGAFERIEAGSLVVRGAGRTQTLPLGPDLRLFRRDAARSTAVGTVQLVGGERLRLHVDTAGAVDFLEVELNPSGVASDRFSPQATWQTVVARRTLAERLRALAPGIGEIQDLEPARFGNSGRAVEIRLRGARDATVVNGYRVRQALGLKDTLFTLSRTRSADGSIESFTFNGRGWGHGVGLCQVGAVGMARAGRSFEEILKTYYRGVEIRQAY